MGIPPVLSQNIAVLCVYCHSRPVAFGKVISGVGCVETVLREINGEDMHAQSDGSLLWQLSGLQSSDWSLAISRGKSRHRDHAADF